MGDASDELAAKVAELETLKKSYEDFMDSSAALEKELEDALKDSEEKCADLAKKKSAAEERYSLLQDKFAASSAQLTSCQKEVSILTEKLTQAESKKVELERVVDELQEMVRILEATESDLTHKLQQAEEDIVFLQTDFEEATADSAENEKRLKVELTELQAELARLESKMSKSADGTEKAEGAGAVDDEERQRQLELIDELELEVEDLTERLTASEQQNQQLNEEVSRLADELIEVHESHAKSVDQSVTASQLAAKQEEIDQLKLQLENVDTQLRAVTASLEEAKEEVDDLSTQLEQQKEKYIHLQLEYDDVKAALLAAEAREKEALANQALAIESSSSNKVDSERIETLEIELRLREETIESLHNKVTQLEEEILGMKQSDNADVPIAVLKNHSVVSSDQNTVSSTAPLSASKTTLNGASADTNVDNDAQSNWKEERESLLREVEYLRNAINSTLVKHQATPRQSPMKDPSRSLSSNPESEQISIPTINLIDSEEVSKRALQSVIESGDVEKLKNMLVAKSTLLETTRKSNAKLLQKLQAARGNIQVCCRPRPPTPSELAAKQGTQVCVDVIDDNEIACFDKRSEVWKSFLFDRVWRMDSSQQDVFSDVEPLVLSVIEGYNTCLFAYGQTGSGKTFTMNGYGDEYGVSYRTLNKIFEVLKQKEADAEAAQQSKTILSEASRARENGTAKRLFAGDDAGTSAVEELDSEPVPFSYKVEVSMMEIYNDQVYDLLSGAAEEALDIRQTGDGTVHVPGLKQVPVFGLDDVLRVFAKGSSNRATAATNLNELSSRSHSVLAVDVTSITNGSPVRAKLFLVDLAGCERASKSGVSGAQMKETQYINKSLSALGDVMEALDQKAKHVPYRNSKLTYLLQDSLGGNSRTMMIVTVCPTEATIDETMFTLGFASRVRNVSLGVARKNVNVKNFEEALKVAKAEVREAKKSRLQLEETIADLKKQLKKTSEKMTTQTEAKGKAYEEAKKNIDMQLQQVNKANQDLVTRLQEEKEAKQKMQQEIELMQKTLKKAYDQLKENLRERERLIASIKHREETLNREHDKDKETNGSSKGTGREKESAVKDTNVVAVVASTSTSALSRPAVRASVSNSTNNHLGPPRRDTKDSASSSAFAVPSRLPIRRLTTSASAGVAHADDDESLNGQSGALVTPSKSSQLTRQSIYDRLASRSIQSSARKSDATPVHTAFGSSISSAAPVRSRSRPPLSVVTDPATPAASGEPGNVNTGASLSPSQIPVLSAQSTAGSAALRSSISSRSKEALQRHQERMEKYRLSHGAPSSS